MTSYKCNHKQTHGLEQDVPHCPPSRSLARIGVGALGLAAAVAVLAWAVGSPVTLITTGFGALHHRDVPFEGLLVTTAGLATWSCLCWFAALVALEIASLAPGSGGYMCARLAARIGPRFLRVSARWLVGVALVTGPLVSGPAMAAGSGGSGHSHPSLDRPVATAAVSPSPTTFPAGSVTPASSASPVTPASPAGIAAGVAAGVARQSAVAGYPTGAALDLDRPVSTYLPPAPAPAIKVAVPDGVALLAGTPQHGTDDDGYVVRRGDSLWDVAARHLGPAATAVDIAREWPRWYSANRAVIGADPSLLRPGEVLYPPAG